MSYPILYESNETSFSTFGIGVLPDTVSALVTEERNGQFYLVMKYPVDGALFKELKNDRLIKADASNNLKDQRFKIERITKPSKGIVTVYANHVSYHSEELQLKPNVGYSGNAQNALNTWRNNIVDSHPFTVYSDIQTEGSGRWTIDKVENARRALGGVQGSILDSYGGEYRFDNYHIGLYAQRGNESGALIAYGKNLIELEQEEEIASTHTSVYPYSVIYNDDGEEELITLPEYFVDSEYVGNYARRKILTVDFSDEDIKTADGLRTRVQRYIKENNVGVPRVNLRVKFIDLSKTLDYKHLKLIEEINLCDWVDIYFEKLDIVRKAKIIAATWDVLLERYHEIEVGESRASLPRNIDTTIEKRLEPVSTRLNIIQTAANGKNKVFRGVDEPNSGMSLNDLWYKPVGDGETELYRFDGSMWLLEKVSAGLLGGTLDAENGDVNLINVNVANIVGNRSEFIQSWWNGIDVSISISAENGIQTIGSNGDRVKFTQGEIDFQRGSQGRHLQYNPEGLILTPYSTNTGTSLNTALILKGITNAANNYIQFEDPQYNHRIRQISSILRIEHDGVGEVRILNRSGADGTVRARIFSTRNGSDTVGNRIMMIDDRLQTPRDGLRDIYISPNGQGKVRVANIDHEYYPIRAIDFENASSRELKTAIEPYRGSALDVINGLNVVEYFMKKDVREGHYNRYIGLISEESPEVASQDGKSIMSYATDAYLIKAVQELSNKVRELESHVITG